MDNNKITTREAQLAALVSEMSSILNSKKQDDTNSYLNAAPTITLSLSEYNNLFEKAKEGHCTTSDQYAAIITELEIAHRDIKKWRSAFYALRGILISNIDISEPADEYVNTILKQCGL